MLQFVVDVLDFVGLPQIGDERASLGRGLLEALERFTGGDDLPHLFLDAREVFFAQRRFDVDVVVETVLDGWPEGELDSREEPHDRARHDVRGAVTKHVEGVAVPVREDLERRLALGGWYLAVEINDRAIDLGGDRGLGKTFADRFGYLARPGAWGYLPGGAIGEFESKHQGTRSSHAFLLIIRLTHAKEVEWGHHYSLYLQEKNDFLRRFPKPDATRDRIDPDRLVQEGRDVILFLVVRPDLLGFP